MTANSKAVRHGNACGLESCIPQDNGDGSVAFPRSWIDLSVQIRTLHKDTYAE